MGLVFVCLYFDFSVVLFDVCLLVAVCLDLIDTCLLFGCAVYCVLIVC